MKSFKLIVFLMILGRVSVTNAQQTDAEMSNEVKATNEVKTDKLSYYKQRGLEDAKYEQQLKAENENEEKIFWEEQENYEKNLKAKDRKAYRAYMKGKQDAYANHYEYCDAHCHHSDHYYHHATFYYYGYNRYYYERQPHYSGVSARVRVASPNVGLSLF